MSRCSAVPAANALLPYRPGWFEEPIPLENAKAMARLGREMPVPIATGERLLSRWEYRDLLVGFRNVRGRVDNFQESFLDNGQENMVEVMKALIEAGYDGPIGPDHLMHLTGDNAHADRYWAYAIGYMRALLQALQHAS